MIQVIPTTGVFQYEPFGFTNCTRYRDVLYLSGISAVDEQGRRRACGIQAKACASMSAPACAACGDEGGGLCAICIR